MINTVISEKKLSQKILFICGSLNQTTMMHQISKHMQEYDLYFTPYYADGYVDILANKGYLDFSILGGCFREDTVKYLKQNNLKIDYKGEANNYDLAFTCSDLIVPHNIRNAKIILVQEGMTDPKNLAYYLVKVFKLPRYIASTSTNGLSDAYGLFCVASEGYKEHFIKNGINPDKIRVTGIPNFDNCEIYKNNSFPYRNFVLGATSDSRETFKYENRKLFIKKCLKIADGRQLIFKLHPNEKYERAAREIEEYAPGALIFHKGNVHEMIANCDVLITKYSTCVYTGIALGKVVYSAFNIDKLKKMTPVQNGGSSSLNIANQAITLLNGNEQEIRKVSYKGKRSLQFKPIRSFINEKISKAG